MRIFLGILLATITIHAHDICLAETCDTNCHDQCRIKTDFPPVEFIEPTCHAKCEIAKKAACATHSEIPKIPITPREQAEQIGTQACSAPFQAITNYVIGRCSNWDGRLDDQQLITQAEQVLQSLGILTPGELNDVQIRWCPLSGAHGMAPDRGRIYLDVGLKGNRIATASTLAHEAVHVRQFRSAGTDNFKCNYSREYVACGGCQDRRNSYEREAYDFEERIQYQLMQAMQLSQVPQPQIAPPQGFPQSAGGLPSGFGMQVCGCWGFNPAQVVSEPRCASGAVRLNICPGFCPGGGNPYAFICQ